MARVISDYLENSAAAYGEELAVVDSLKSITFKQLQKAAKSIATEIIKYSFFKKPIAVYLDKGCDCISAYMGIAYSGNFYSPLDTHMPKTRIDKIIDTLEPVAVLTDKAHEEEVKAFCGAAIVICIEAAVDTEINDQAVSEVCAKILDTDILYVLFTSGSTGVPKGVIISHKAVIDFTDWGTERFGIDNHYVFGNQTPFYFSMSVFDIYQTIKNGAKLYVIPKELFSFPVNLMQYLKENKINTLFWVPSALCFISVCGALNSPHLNELKNVFFGGEVMPMKQLNRWVKEYPNARYVNFYGPTEVTDTCTVYELNRDFPDTEKLPMGLACRNMDVFLLNENDNLVAEPDVIGEVCVRGTGLAFGYYKDPEKTKAVFVQNPLNEQYPETIYRTGDLAQYNEFGELVYISRKDSQIKHMGHRIELGEIEAAVSSVEGVDANCCLYDGKKSRIILFYKGTIEENDLINELKTKLPTYMLPNKKYRLEDMPYNLNGKIDRQKLKERL